MDADTASRRAPRPGPSSLLDDNRPHEYVLPTASSSEDESEDEGGAPPPRLLFKGLEAAERHAARREFEKAMFNYINRHGTLSESTKVCGPCERTRTSCVRHPLIKKCSICFRGHDVCEKWDATVENMGRRRVGPKTPRRETKVVFD